MSVLITFPFYAVCIIRQVEKEEKMKHLSDEEMWNRMITIVSFLLYTTCVILAVLSLYFTSGPTNEDLVLGGKFMLALAALVIARFALSDLLRRQ